MTSASRDACRHPDLASREILREIKKSTRCENAGKVADSLAEQSPQQTSSTIYYSTVFITETTAVPKLDNEISAVYSYLAILKLIIGPMGFRVRNGCMAHFVPNVEKSSADYLQTSEKLAAYLWEMMTLWE